MNPIPRYWFAPVVLATCLATGGVHAADIHPQQLEKPIRMGRAGSVTTMSRRTIRPPIVTAEATRGTNRLRPRLVGFSPLLAVVTSNQRSHDDIDYEHDLEPRFVGTPLAPPASLNYAIGILDSGSVADLAIGSGASQLGLFGSRLTGNVIEFGGVGGSIFADVTHPLGVFAAGLSAVDGTGFLNVNRLVGHSNVSMAVLPPLSCGAEETFTAIIGTAFLSFYNSIIRVDTPRRINFGGLTLTSPDVQLQDPAVSIPNYAHSIGIEIGGLLPVQTASYYIDINADPEDPGYLITPASPTALSLTPLTQALGAAYFANIQLAEGEPSPTNLPVTARMMVDTGAQTTIISRGLAASMSLPRDPDFTLDACGVGGIVPDIPGYYIDFVKISALGGALEYERAPVVVIDLPSPEGGALDGVLGMNFFWDRNVILEPSLLLPGFLHVSDPVAIPFADFDLDLDVDDTDAFFALACSSGPESLTPSAECDHLDWDEDQDVDLRDFARFQNCFSGDGHLAGAACGE